MSDVVMPRLSDSMEEGTILRWLKADGERVRRGEPLVEIETDKANMTYDADRDGEVELIAQEGQTLAIGQLIARIRAQDRGAAEAAPSTEAAAVVAQEAGAVAQEAGAVAQEAGAVAQEAGAVAQEAGAPAPAPVRSDGRGAPEQERIKVSPIARRIAAERGVDLRALTGTGPGGRIVRADVEAAGASAVPAEQQTASASAPPLAIREKASASALPAAPPSHAPGVGEVERAKGEVTPQELTRSQQVIARRMAESRATIPDFVLHAEVDMEECQSLREQLKQLAADAPPPSFNDMVVKASALALREFPRVNGSYRDGRFELHSRVNVGVAVATEDGLTVPVVLDADRKSLGEIARESRALAERVRTGVITPPELSGGTFTVSNLGMYGIKRFSAVINPPQAAILAVGAIEPRPAVRDGAIEARRLMEVTLACDHRILYGAEAARFLARTRELLEQPLALTL
jgi:pyruvate dehydrogenase E2 component (dihydrolipoamide acetyltransferase)